MGLTFYIGEIQAQGSEAAQMNQQASQAIVSLQSSISQFLSAPLSGKAYDSAKNYFSVVYTPLCRSAMMTGEALERAHKQLLSEYQGMVSSIDTDEDKINSQIDRLEQLKRELERQMHVSKTMRPDLERRYINACEVIAKKRELLEKFHAYNARSASIFSEYDTCQQEFNTGLAQVKDCQAWNASTGTFDISRLNMIWAKSINERWDKRAKELEKQRAKKFAKGMKDRYYQRVQLASGAYVWMWVKDPMSVTQEDFQFNEKYKDYLRMLMAPETSVFDEYYQTLAEELRTGINQRTGKPLTDLEKAQRWAEVASALALVAVGAYYGKKGFTEGKKVSGPKYEITWNKNINPTQEVIPNTNIPKSFTIKGTSVNGKEVWVHGNASKHMGEFINSAKGSIITENELMLSFQDSVSSVLPKVKPGRNFFNINGWEIGINGDTGVIYHALYKP